MPAPLTAQRIALYMSKRRAGTHNKPGLPAKPTPVVTINALLGQPEVAWIHPPAQEKDITPATFAMTS